MVATAFNDLSSIAGGLVMNIVRGFGILLFSVALYFITKWVKKGTKKQKSFNTTAIIIDLNGVVVFDKLGFMKSEKSGLLEMQFQNRKTDSIPPISKHLIKNNHVMLLNYAPGHYSVIDTSKTIKNIESGLFEFELVNLGMKKYLMSKQREILNNLEDKKRKWEQYAPWITLSIGVIVVVILAAFLFYVGIKMDSANVESRVQECISMGWKS